MSSEKEWFHETGCFMKCPCPKIALSLQTACLMKLFKETFYETPLKIVTAWLPIYRPMVFHLTIKRVKACVNVINH